MPDLRPDIAPFLAAFGVPASVTLPGGEPVVTTAIWLPPVQVETPGVLFPTAAPQPALSLPAALFAADAITGKRSVPRGTLIECARATGAPVVTWSVEAIADDDDPDMISVIVIPGDS
jgi:hypothetical protein